MKRKTRVIDGVPVNNVCTFLDEQRKEVKRLYWQAMSLSSPPYSTVDVIRKLRSLPCSRYYVSEQSAYEYCRRRLHGKHVLVRNSSKRILFESLFAKVKEIVSKGESIPHAVLEAIKTPAPTIGLSERYIRTILFRSKSK